MSSHHWPNGYDSRGTRLGFYQEQLLPRLQDKVMARKPNRAVRALVCDGLHGAVLEIGFGTGLNAPYYPGEVTKVVAVEPSRVCMRIAEPRVSGIRRGALDVDPLHIPNVEAALAELRRVLKPGGSLHFVEHGHAPDENIVRWQERLEPLNKRLAGGCHLTRHISEDIEGAGFEIDKLDTYYFRGEPKPMGFTYEGRAVSR